LGLAITLNLYDSTCPVPFFTSYRALIEAIFFSNHFLKQDQALMSTAGKSTLSPGLEINLMFFSDAHGFTPLHYAAMRKQTDAIELLLSHGADTNAVSDTLKLTRMFRFT
jgi:ankyrin repeat protein